MTTTSTAPSALPQRTASTTAFACAAMMVSYLPFSAANGMLGTIAGTTGAGTGQLQWVSDAFAVALAATVLSGGLLGDLWGRRRVTVAGLGLTAAGAVVGLAAGWLPGTAAVHGLWAGQALAGVGGGLVMSATLALVATLTPTARDRGISLWATSVVIGLGAGPFLAGAVTARAGWQWVYLPIAVLALATALGAARVPESVAPGGRRPDLWGQATAATGITALTVAVINGGAAGWTSAATLGAAGVALAALTAFVRGELSTPAPLLRLQLFASGPFTAAGLAAMTVLFTIAGGLFTLSLFFSAQHVSGLGIALRLGCLFLGNAVTSLAAGPLQRRVGARAVLLTGLAVTGLGVATLLGLGPGTGLPGVAGRLLVVGIGGGLVMATASAVAVRSAPGPVAGMAGAANNALRQLGAVLGPAVLGTVYATRTPPHGTTAEAVHLCVAVLLAVVTAATVICALLLTTVAQHAAVEV